ncbi:unnamed protein product [Arabis nemorensis]|uniref:Uncharacterized protein n=1 Tax=Arabis nemorensis TaxID=586526 RepID=A0A565ANH8_9BRAS|nr:unnamed protein product [Arabis nemorensis]
MRSFCGDGARETVEEEEKLPPSDSEREEPQQSPDRCSLTLLGNHDINENPPNPNSQTSPSSGKRRSTSGGFKKVKKPRPHEPPEAVSEVVSPPKWLDQVMKFKEETKAPHRISKAPLTCEDARLIFEKELSVSDVNPKQSRYLMPFNQLKRNDFLTQVESSFIEQEEDEEGDKPGIGVILVNQKAEKWFEEVLCFALGTV